MKSLIIIIVVCVITTFQVFSQNNTNNSKIILISGNDKFVSYDNCLTWKAMYDCSKLVFAKWANGEKQYSTNNGISWKTYLAMKTKENMEDLNAIFHYNNGKISIIFNSSTQFRTNLKIFDVTGNIVFNEAITVIDGTNNIERMLPNIHAGTYYLIIILDSDTKLVYNFLVD